MTAPASAPPRLPIVVLISGNGSNLQAIIDASRQGLPVDIRAVISNRSSAYGLQRAARAGIAGVLINHDEFRSREDFEHALREKIDSFEPQLIVLAGFMRILGDDFVRHYQGKLINIHPSLLPKFRGLNTHQRALDAHETTHGATVHYVTPELDDGPAILQARVSIQPGDNAAILAKRVQQKEHDIYPLAIRWIAESRIQYRDGRVYFDSRLLNQPIEFTPELNSRTDA